jgi:uncharacterized protein YgbK (DUF1537 family)
VAAAEARIQERRLLLLGARTIVKQFDSTLRGHVAAECYATLRTSNRRSLLVIAAFPSEGRTTVNGIQLLHGLPVEETDFRFDPLNPVRTSSLPDLFATVSKSIRCARSVSEARAVIGDCEIVILDAETETQLDDAVAALRAESDVVWAGSTGLLRALSRSWPLQSCATTRTDIPVSHHPLLVVGSRNKLSRQQLLALEPSARTFTLDCSASDSDRVLSEIRREKPHGVVAIVTTSDWVDPLLINESLGKLAAKLISEGLFDGIVATGGETVKSILENAGVKSIECLGEIEPGIPLCIARSDVNAFSVVTKAGGFGSSDVFTNAIRLLHEPEALHA